MSQYSPVPSNISLLKQDDPVFINKCENSSLTISQRDRRTIRTRVYSSPKLPPKDASFRSNTSGLEDECDDMLSKFTVPLPNDSDCVPRPQPSVQSQALFYKEKPEQGLYGSLLHTDVKLLDSQIREALQSEQGVIEVPRTVGSVGKAQKAIASRGQKRDQQSAKQRPKNANKSIDKGQRDSEKKPTSNPATQQCSNPASTEIQWPTQKRAITTELLNQQKEDAEMIILQNLICKIRRERVKRQQTFRKVIADISRQIVNDIEANNLIEQQNSVVAQQNSIIEQLNQLPVQKIQSLPVQYLVEKINDIKDIVEIDEYQLRKNIIIEDMQQYVVAIEKISEKLRPLADFQIAAAQERQPHQNVMQLLQQARQMQYQLASILDK